MAMRNGVVADALRRSGAAPHRLVFGVNLPQLMEIAREAGHDPELAAQLWADTQCRESRLLATMIGLEVGPEAMDAVQSAEEADMLCMKVLRHQQDVRIDLEGDSLHRYAALRLLQYVDPKAAIAAARDEIKRHDPLTRILANQIINDSEDFGEA